MHYIASVHAYDVMDSIVITAEVRSTEDSPERPTASVLRATTVIVGIGETDPREWLQDALVGILEEL